MSDQAVFLARVRQALHAGQPATHGATDVATPAAPETVSAIRARLQAQRPQLVARLQEELSAVSGHVVRAQSVADATRYIQQVARDHGARLVVRWQSALLEALEIDAALAACGVEVHTAAPTQTADMDAQRQALRQRLAHADIGLSGADFAIAETGTLALSALPGQMRGVSLLPPVHVAVIRSAHIVATLADALALLQAEGEGLQERLTSCLALITGPSRTADIELSLTVGVHGPGELHLVILDDPEAGTHEEK